MDSSALYVVALHVARHVFHCSEGSFAFVVAIVLLIVLYGLVCSRKRLRRIFGPARRPWEFDLDEIPSWLLLGHVLRHNVNIPLKTASPVVSWLVEHHWDKMQYSPFNYEVVEYGNSRHREQITGPVESFPIWFDGDKAVTASLWNDYHHCRMLKISLRSNSTKALQDCMRHLQLCETPMWECVYESIYEPIIKRVRYRFAGRLSQAKVHNLEPSDCCHSNNFVTDGASVFRRQRDVDEQTTRL